MEQSSIITRARAQKLNNLHESVNKLKKKSEQSPRGKRPVNAKDDLGAIIKQNARKKLLNAKVTVSESKKGNISSRRYNAIEEIESEDEAAIYKDDSINSDKLKKILKDKADSIPIIRLNSSDLSQWTNSKDFSETSKKAQEKTSLLSTERSSSGIVTPKSTPIKLSLTPHRSTKTPKKSPISLSSPKTHSVSVSRLLKIPRKLSLTPGEDLFDKYNNDSGDKKLRKAKKDSSRNTSNKSSSTSPVVKNKRNISSVKLKEIVFKFSKSPKIVLRSPSKKSKSPKLNLSISRKHLLKKPTFADTLSPGISPSHSSTKSLSVNRKRTPSPKSKNLSANNYHLLTSRLVKLLTASQMRDILAEPIVLLKKLSLKSKQDILMTIGNNNQLNNSINTENNAKISQATAGNTPADTSTLSVKDGSRERLSVKGSSTAKVTNRSANKLSLTTATEHDLSTQRKNKSSTPLMSSTPREEQTPLTRISLMSNTYNLSDDTYPNTRSRSRYMNQSGMHTAALSPNIMNGSATIEDVSSPSLLDVDISDTSHPSNAAKRQDTTYDVNEATELKNNKKDITYELKDPQTPGLRQMIKKRTMMDVNLSTKEDVKKFCRVRFANVKPDENGAHNSISKSIGLQSSVPRNSSIQRNNRIINSAHKTSSKVQILKSNKNSLISPLNAKLSSKICRVTPKGRLHGLNAVTLNLSKLQTTSKGFESVEKKSEKKSSIKKVPNFRRIHEKMFANSESIVDAKKRLETRHLEFAAKKVLPEVDVKKGVKLLPPSDTTNGTYNRFGFKLRKAEATHVILKKQTVFSRQKQQHETRTVLKSVRTNRRFELQMKARNISMI